MQNDDFKTNSDRRKFVKLAAGSAVVLPIAGLVGCGGGDEKTVAAKAEEAAAATAEAAKDTVDAAGEMAGDAADAVGEMAGDAKDAAGEMMDDAGAMADDAKAAMGDMADDAKEAAGDMVDGAKEAAGDMADKAAGAVSDGSGGLPKVKEDDAVAQALGYKHDANSVDQGKYAGRGGVANEACENCVLFIAGKDGWGACSIFAGKSVNAKGWCASYNRKTA
ncbi:MAG: high-potential iron-sulfur protein [Woeseiaceae bacterium]